MQGFRDEKRTCGHRRKSCCIKECERQDLNLHGLPHWILNPARLPIPPLSQQLLTNNVRRFRLVRKLGTVAIGVPKYGCNPFRLIGGIVLEIVFLSRGELLVTHDSLQIPRRHASIGQPLPE